MRTDQKSSSSLVMEPEESPELPPLKRGTYDLDAILAAAENAEFAIPPVATKTSFNANPFASSSPSAFRANFNSSSTPSIDNSPYPTASPLDEFDFPAPPTQRPPASPAKKPLTTATTRKKVSPLKSTLNKYSAPKKPDLESPIAETPAGAMTADINISNSHIANSNISNGFSGDTTTRNNNDLSFEDKRTGFDDISSPPIVNTIKPRPLRPSPFARVSSPPVTSGSHLETSSPSRASSPNNVSSNSIGAGNELAVYSTPSSSRPTSRPTSRPNSRVSNGRYHSRQLSSDSLMSFNAMVDKEDHDDDGLSRSGHVSFVVSDPEHLRILEGEIEDPFSPSMSSIDPDTDAYLSNLIQQTSPFGSIKSNSRGQSPAFKSRRQRQTEGDESFMDSTDDALSDKEPNSKFRTTRSGTRTPVSPLARALTRPSPRQHSDNLVLSSLMMTKAESHPSLDQVLRDNQGLNEGQDSAQGSMNAGSASSSRHMDSQDRSKINSGSKDLPSSQPESPTPKPDGQLSGKSDKRDAGDTEHVEVDIVVQNVNFNDDNAKKNSLQGMNGLGIDYSDLDYDDEDDAPFNQSGGEVLANEEMHLHESLEVHESHAQSFAEWMSSSAEISRLDISPPVSHGQFPQPSLSGMLTSAPLPIASTIPSPHGTSLLSSNLGEANVLTSSYTPAISSPEATLASSLSTSPNAKRTMLLEKRSNLMEDILAKAKEHTKHKSEANQLLSAAEERKKTLSTSPPTTRLSGESSEAGTTSHSVTFTTVSDVKIAEKPSEESDITEGDGADTASTSMLGLPERKDYGLVRRPSGVMLSSRIRDSTNLDAPRYSIREMEDMKKNVRMDLRIEITNEIREEYERSAEQEAAIYQSEIEELKTALEKEKKEKEGLKSVLDEFESSLADFAVSTATEIQTIKEQNKKLAETKEETEEAFITLKTRYDELKDLNSKHVDNDGILRKAIETLKRDFETSESRYENLKGHADMKLLQASQEMEQARIVYDNEIAMLKGQMGRQEMQMRTLEQALEIKNKENEDLILFSEELIAKLS
ncbi:Transforming acidic coiled-coil-containing protein 2 [Mortierella sp. AM989]|nr:Transforming acidic coiled-coil-containing protein 2 [Mortierella sp. AM989]